MADNSNQTGTPAYISYSTFKNALDLFTEKGLPSSIDASVLPTMSGSNRSALMNALRFLGLISSEDKPTDALRTLVKDSGGRKTTLELILKKHYPKSLNELANGTHISVKKNFEYEVSDAIKSKCVNFFLALAKEVDVPISSHIMENVRVRRPRRRTETSFKQKTNQSQSNSPSNAKGSIQTEGWQTENLKSLPITVGTKVWKIAIDESYTDDEIRRFTEMIKLALMRNT